MSLSKMHFVKAARIVSDLASFNGRDGGGHCEEGIAKAEAACDAFVALFSACSCAFDEARFRDACGIEHAKADLAADAKPKRKPRGWASVNIDTPQ